MTKRSRCCGTIAIVGRPNVGKSTLLNRIVGQKISITSRKPQTTRYRILGVRTAGNTQMIFVDTPGWQSRPRGRLNRVLNREIDAALSGVDVVVMVADARAWKHDDERVLGLFESFLGPRLLVLNKHDLLGHKSRLLPLIADINQRGGFREVLPMNARRGDNIETLVKLIAELLPADEHRFPHDQITDRSERFLVSELIREQLIRGLGNELPYSVSVVIESFSDEVDKTEILARIWVEREGQKGIVIGAKGARLKAIATAARLDIEAMLGRRVFLEIQVKTKENWSDDASALRELDLEL